MKIKTIYIIGFLAVALILGETTYAQNQPSVTVNHGELYVLPNTLISAHNDFENTTDGVVFNDGEFQFYKNYVNNGLFTHTSNLTTSKTAFLGSETQIIAGVQPSKHYGVVFNNTQSGHRFQLKSDMIIDGVSDFTRGIVTIDSLAGGSMLFTTDGSTINTSD